MDRRTYALRALVALLALTTPVKICLGARVHPHGKTNTEFIRSRCEATTYPRLCFQSLSSHASAIQTSPMQLAHTALSLTLTGAQSAAAMIGRLSTAHGVRPREVGAMRDCIENMGSSIDELRESMAQMGHLKGPDFDLQINNIQTWVSAALTDEDTCMDGFAGKAMNGNVKSMVRGRIVNVARLTSNALALINGLASLQSKSP
eukprot:TRINITY_DN5973_c2_g1_i1.p1 TRINITY_DN5973_c2_g1~~TRINITY_DN5973_c2_g1_i1.p1  ORF type:complete len:204 (+),score=27.44 TRINITY_DN5973_c2_g1_i1:423-1034(+)